MNELFDDWLVLMKNLPGIKTDEYFIAEMNKQLQIKFELLTNKKFDGKRFYLFIESVEDIKYYYFENDSYGQISASLMLIKGRTDVLIEWRNNANNKLISPNEDHRLSQLIFQWIKLNINDEAIKNLTNIYYDLREIYNIKNSVLVKSYVNYIGTDILMVLMFKANVESNILEDVVQKIINDWNTQHEIEDSHNSGYVHSFTITKTGKKTIEIQLNTGNSDERFIISLIENLNLKILPIKEIEIINK